MSRPKQLWLSPSQLKTFSRYPGPAQADTCGRKYYFEHGLRLPRPPISSAILGDVIHNVIERWLKADELGLDPFTKEPVNLYPEGWDANITQDDSERTRKLILQAEEEGLLRRSPKRMVECETKTLLGNFNGKAVYMVGRLDLAEPETPEEIPTITDWKSSSNFKYALSNRKNAKRYMGRDIQMLWYGLWFRLTFDIEGPIRLRQIYFPTKFDKDADDVQFKDVSIVIQPEELDAFGEWLTEQCAKAVLLRQDGRKEMPTTGACDMYGGCHFRDICNGCITVDQYTTIHEKNENKQEEDTNMAGLLGRFKNKEAGGTDVKEEKAEKNAASETEVENTETEANPPETKTTRRRGLGRSKPVQSSNDESGSDSSEVSEKPVETKSETTTATKKRGLGRGRSKSAEKTETGTGDKTASETTDKRTDENSSSGKADKPGDNPALDLIVLVNAVPRLTSPEGRSYLSLHTMALNTFGFIVNQEREKKKIGKGVHWLDMDAFARRELIWKYQDQIMPGVQGYTIYTDGVINPDQKELLNMLLTFAPTVIYGV